MRTALVVIAASLLACGDDGGSSGDAAPERGHVDVLAYLAEENGQVPAAGALVVFQDLDGSSRSTTVDAQGHAEGEIQAGGTVWLARFTAQMFGSNLLTAYADVQPGSTLFFGPPEQAETAVAGTLTVNGGPTVQFDYVRAYSTCGRTTGDTRVLEFTASCGSTLDIVAVAYRYLGMSNYAVVSYAYLPAQPAVNASTIDVPADAWKDQDFDTMTLQLTHGSDVTVTGAQLSDDFGIYSGGVFSQTSGTVTAHLPVVGQGLRIQLQITKTGTLPRDEQSIAVRTTAATNVSINVDSIMAPWVTQPTTNLAPWTWQEDDKAGSLRADAMVTTYRWMQPKANYSEGEVVQIISAPRPAGDLPLPQLPSELAADQPAADFQINAYVWLMRIEGFDADPLRFAQQMTRRALGALALDEVQQGSVAITTLY